METEVLVTPAAIAAGMLAGDPGSGPTQDVLLRSVSAELEACFDQLTAAPTAAAAADLVARSVTGARYVARRCTDIEVLTELFAKDRRLTVRRELAANEAITESLAAEMLTWAARPNAADNAAFFAILDNPSVSWTTVFDTFAATGFPEWVDPAAIVRRLTGPIDDGMLAQLCAVGSDDLVERLARKLFEDQEAIDVAAGHDGISREGVDEVLARFGEAHATPALCAYVSSRRHGVIDEPLARATRAAFDGSDRELSGFVSGWGQSPLAPHRLDEAAALLWVESPNRSLQIAALASWALPATAVDRFVDDSEVLSLLSQRAAATNDVALARRLLTGPSALSARESMQYAPFFADVAADIFAASTAPGVDDVALDPDWMVIHLFAHLDEPSRLEVLRRGSLTTTSIWASAGDANGPRLGEFAALCADPGFAFCDRSLSDARDYDDVDLEDLECDFLDVEAAVRFLLPHTKQAFSELVMGELLDHLPAPFTAKNVELSWTAPLLRRRVLEATDDPAALEMAVNLAPDWDGTIPELVSVAAGVASID